MSHVDNYRRILEEIAEAAVRYGRRRNDVTLIAVTKDVAWDDALSIYFQGQRDFGESRIAKALKKQSQAPNDCNWHLIGTLQANKVSKAVGHFNLIHSVDSVSLARKISQHSQKLGIKSSILLQANTSGESTKHGLTPEAWKVAFKEILNLPCLSIEGLMTMAPANNGERVTRYGFAALRQLRGELLVEAGENAPLIHLSMGMSRDFAWAIAEGATLLRIGKALWSSSPSI